MLAIEAGYVVGIQVRASLANPIKYVQYNGGSVYPRSWSGGDIGLTPKLIGATRYDTLCDVQKDLGRYAFHQSGAMSGNKFADREMGESFKLHDSKDVKFHPELEGVSLAKISIHRVDLLFQPVTITGSDVDEARHVYLSANHQYGVEDLGGFLGNPKKLGSHIKPIDGCEDGGYLLLDKTFVENYDQPEFAANNGTGSFLTQSLTSPFAAICAKEPNSSDFLLDDDEANFYGVISRLYLNTAGASLAHRVVPARVGLRAASLSADFLQSILRIEEHMPNGGEAYIRSFHRLHRRRLGIGCKHLKVA